MAEEASVDVLFTTDQNIRYQQILSGRKIALVVLAGNYEMVARATAPGAYLRNHRCRNARKL